MQKELNEKILNLLKAKGKDFELRPDLKILSIDDRNWSVSHSGGRVEKFDDLDSGTQAEIRGYVSDKTGDPLADNPFLNEESDGPDPIDENPFLD